jgi:hypothetical protein
MCDTSLSYPAKRAQGAPPRRPGRRNGRRKATLNRENADSDKVIG